MFTPETGNYKESDNLKPFNNYGWSKLGGECAVNMYENSDTKNVYDRLSIYTFKSY